MEKINLNLEHEHNYEFIGYVKHMIIEQYKSSVKFKKRVNYELGYEYYKLQK